MREDGIHCKVVNVWPGTVGTPILTLWDGTSGPTAARKRNGVYVANSKSKAAGSYIYIGVGDTDETFTLSADVQFASIQPTERSWIPFIEGIPVKIFGSTVDSSSLRWRCCNGRNFRSQYPTSACGCIFGGRRGTLVLTVDLPKVTCRRMRR